MGGHVLRCRAIALAALAAGIDAGAGIGLAGCSGESTRFNENPFAPKRPDRRFGPQTGRACRPSREPAVAAAAAHPAPVAANHGTVGGGVAGVVRPRADRLDALAGGRSRPLTPPKYRLGRARRRSPPVNAPVMDLGHGGTARYRHRQGDTVESISRRSRRAGDGPHPGQQPHRAGTLQPGQQLVIPRYVAPRLPPLAAPTRVATAAPWRRGRRPRRPAAPAPRRCGGRQSGRARRRARRDAEQDLRVSTASRSARSPRPTTSSPTAPLKCRRPSRHSGRADRQAAPKIGPCRSRTQSPRCSRRSREHASEPVQSASLITPVVEPPTQGRREVAKRPARCRRSAGRRTGA